MAERYVNNYDVVVPDALQDSATDIMLSAGDAAAIIAVLTPGDGIRLTLTGDIQGGGAGVEIVLCTSGVGDTLTVTRARDGTSALTFLAGAHLSCRFTAGSATELRTDDATAAAHIAAAAPHSGHATTGAVTFAQASADAAQADVDAHESDFSNPHGTTKSQVGLGNVDNLQQIPLSQKAAANGVAPLDAGSIVPAVNSRVQSVAGKTGAVTLDHATDLSNVGTTTHAQIDSQIPSTGQKAALAGTSGTPGAGNAYVTDADARNADTRIPTDNTVSTAKIVDAAVTTGKINDSAVTTGKLNDASVTTAKINDGAVTASKLDSTAKTATLASKLDADWILLIEGLTTGTAQPLSIADASFAGKVAGGSVSGSGVAGVVAIETSVALTETGSGAGQAGLGANDPLTDVAFAGQKRISCEILKVDGDEVALADVLSTAALADRNAHVYGYLSRRPDLGANLKWRMWFYYHRADGVEVAFVPDTSIANTKLYVVEVFGLDVKPIVAGIGKVLLSQAAAALGPKSVPGTALDDSAVTTVKINDAAVTTAKINDAAVTAVKLGAKAVGNAAIDDGAVRTLQLGTGAQIEAAIRAGIAAATAAFDMNGKAITNVGLVDGYQVSALGVQLAGLPGHAVSDFGVDGVTQTARGRINAKSGPGVTVTNVDNSGTNSFDATFTGAFPNFVGADGWEGAQSVTGALARILLLATTFATTGTVTPNSGSQGGAIRASTSITVNDTLDANALGGGQVTGGTLGTAGGANTTGGTGGGGSAGNVGVFYTNAAAGGGGAGAGGSGVGGNGSPGSNSVGTAQGGGGGGGGAGGASTAANGGNGGGGNSSAASTRGVINPARLVFAPETMPVVAWSTGAIGSVSSSGGGGGGGGGGAGGSGGAGGNGNTGGVGGAGGGFWWLGSPTLTGTGTIRANGANGGNGANGVAAAAATNGGGGGGSGGGGGGGGGIIVQKTRTQGGSLTITANGGTGGSLGSGAAGNGTGSAGGNGNIGGNGSAGQVYQVTL